MPEAPGGTSVSSTAEGEGGTHRPANRCLGAPPVNSDFEESHLLAHRSKTLALVISGVGLGHVKLHHQPLERTFAQIVCNPAFEQPTVGIMPQRSNNSCHMIDNVVPPSIITFKHINQTPNMDCLILLTKRQQKQWQEF